MAPPFAPPAPPMAPPLSITAPKLEKKKRLKKLHWATLHQFEGTIWKEIEGTDVGLDKEMTRKLDEMFVIDSPTKNRVGKYQAKEKLKLIDEKRAHKLGILLRRISALDFDEMKENVLNFDIQALDDEVLNSFIACEPTEKEVVSIVAYKGDLDLLGPVETFFRKWTVIPRLWTRLRIMQFSKKCTCQQNFVIDFR